MYPRHTVLCRMLYVAIDGTTGPPDKAKNRKSDKGKKKKEEVKEESEEKKE